MSVRNLRGTGGVSGLQENRDCQNSQWSDSRTEEEWLDILLLQSLGSGRSFRLQQRWFGGKWDM